jgi:hypothetical protein
VPARNVVTSQRERNVPDVVTHRYGNSNMAAQTTTWPPELYYNIYCLDVVTSISIMIRMIKTTHFILKSVEKIQLQIKSDKNNGYFTRIPLYIYANMSLDSFRTTNVSKLQRKLKHIL